MRKLLVGSIGLILISFLLIKIGFNILPDCGIYNSQDAHAANVLAIGALDEVMNNSSASAFMEQIHEAMSESTYDILYVEATDSSDFGFRYSQMTFAVETVLEGNKELLGKKLPVYIPTQFGFYEYDAEERQRVSNYLNGKGYTAEKYPELHNKKDVFYGHVNLPVCGHQYIIFVEEVIPDDNIGTLYYMFAPYFDKTDADQDRLLTLEDPNLSHYTDNITLFYHQSDLDTYCKLKKDLFSYFRLET